MGNAVRTITVLAGWRRWLLLCGFAFVVRLIWLFALTDTDVVQSDASHYHEIASNLAAGRGFTSVFPQLSPHATAFRPPVYPFVLSGAYRVFGSSVMVGKLTNVAIGLVVVVLADFVGRRCRRIRTAGADAVIDGDDSIASPAAMRAGFCAAIVVAAYPPLIANDVNILTEPLGLALLLGVVLFLDRGRMLPAGVLTGLLVLTRPSAQFLVVFLAIWVIRSFGWKRAGAFVAVTILVVTPWIVRNVSQVDTVDLVTSNGFNLAAMYSPEAQQTRAFVDPVSDVRFERYRLDQFDEALWDRGLRELGVRGIRDHPSYVIKNVVRNTAATFELWPPYNQGPERQDGRNLTARNASLPIFYLVTTLGLVGLWTNRRQTATHLIVLGGVYFTAVSLLLVAPPRLRAPWDLMCCIGFGLFIAARLERSDRQSAIDEIEVPAEKSTPVYTALT